MRSIVCRFLGWFTRDTVEAELKRFGRYPLAPLQVVFYVLVACGVVGGELGAGDLFWHESAWHQFTVGFAVSWLFGTVLFVTILLLPPRALPGLPDDGAPAFRASGERFWSLYYSANPGVRQVGRRVLLWLLALGAALYVCKWGAVLSNLQRSGSATEAGTDSVTVFGSQLFGAPFLLGFVIALALGALATRLAERSRVRTAREWTELRDSFARPEARVPTSPFVTVAGLGGGPTLPGSVAMAHLKALEAAGGPVPPLAPYEGSAANNLWTMLQLHALAYSFGMIILFALGLCVLQLLTGRQLFSPVAFITLYVILLNVLGGFVVFRYPNYRLVALGAIAYLLAANAKSGALVPYVLAAVAAVAVGTRLVTAWRFGALAVLVLTAATSRAAYLDWAARWWLVAAAFVVLVGYVAAARLARHRSAPGWRWGARALGWAVVALFAFGNNFGCKPFPMSYDGIGWKAEHAGAPTAAYDDPRPLTEDYNREGQPQPAGTDDRPDLITAKDLLERFKTAKKESVGETSGKPRLVLVAVSGGGIRAAVWTGVVLEGLDREFGPGFRDRVRVITGASGGMVGAAAYAAKLDLKAKSGANAAAQNARTGLHPFAESLARDSLSPVAQTMLVRDFTWNTLFPNRYHSDRGRTLEDAWNTNFTKGPRTDEYSDTEFQLFDEGPLARPMRALAKDERACARPSLIFAPIMVEDTKRLLVSNLDLDHLTHPIGHRLDVIPNPADAPLARPAVEFFRLFPNSDTFAVGSAARMSASFPVVSPAVALPTKPVRRVVDAGYFDNYGINVLANWLLANKADVIENTSGVLIVQARAYPLEKGGMTFEDGSESALDLLIGAVSAPLSAVFTARGSAAYHRNNQQLAELHRAFNAPGAHPHARPNFFATTVFELQQDAALSWYLTTAQKRQVAEGFYKKTGDAWAVRDDVQKQITAMKEWFQKP